MQVETIIIPRGDAVSGVVMPQLSHGNAIGQVVTGEEVFTATDGVWTETPGMTLGVTTADCAPICFYDGVRVGIAHVGWRGLATGLTQRMLELFSTDNVQVQLGPHLHTFEVQRDDCYDALHATCGSEFFTEQTGCIQFHFTRALLAALPADTNVDDRDTKTDTTLPSYRHGRNDERILTTVRF